MPPKEDLVMYEMHLGTFTADIPGNGTPFEKATKRLPYLKALGINCIQLMPVNEFSGERSWGYNPGDLFAVESTYGGADGFKAFIRACHTNGLAVLLLDEPFANALLNGIVDQSLDDVCQIAVSDCIPLTDVQQLGCGSVP